MAKMNEEFNFLTERDVEILHLMSKFNGRIFTEVLEKTIWLNYKNAKSQARNRLGKLQKKYNLFIKKNTNLQSPRSCFAASEQLKEIIRTLFDVQLSSSITVSPVTVHHTIMEMITFYHLSKIGRKVERTIVKNWSQNHKHTPDLFYEKDGKKVYVEIERSFKNAGSYNGIFAKIIQDKVDLILYVVENEKRVLQFAKALPKSEKLRIVSIETLVKNCSENGKVGAKTQKEILKEVKNG